MLIGAKYLTEIENTFFKDEAIYNPQWCFDEVQHMASNKDTSVTDYNESVLVDLSDSPNNLVVFPLATSQLP